MRGISSAGRALHWQCRGQGFESPILHQKSDKARSYGFEPFAFRTLSAVLRSEERLGIVFAMSTPPEPGTLDAGRSTVERLWPDDFDSARRWIFSPYRVCPIGAHVDHNLGLVCGMAIDRGITVGFVPRNDDRVRLLSSDFEGRIELELGKLSDRPQGDWGDYARGAAQVLIGAGHSLRRGFDAVLCGGLPVGGLSSSAAVGAAYLLCLAAAHDLELDPFEAARLHVRSEVEFVGLNVGLLDPAMIFLAEAGSLLELDCASEAFRRIPGGASVAPWRIAVAHSGIERQLVAGTGFNDRVAECRTAARELATSAGIAVDSVDVLRDISPETYAAHRGELTPVSARRAAHFFGECERVQKGVSAWSVGDLEAFGAQITASGRSSIECYETGCPELQALYEAFIEQPGVYGSRFSGGGFGGACIAWVEADAGPEVLRAVEKQYVQQFPERAEGFRAFLCQSGPAAGLVG